MFRPMLDETTVSNSYSLEPIMTAHQKTTQIDAAQVTQFLEYLRRQTQIEIESTEDPYVKERLDHAIDVIDVAAAAFDVAINMIVPFDAD